MAMACFSFPDALATLKKGREEVPRQFRELQERYYTRTYKNARAREYALQGFCRRLDELVRAIDFVFDILPPEQENIPESDNVVAATMLIQAFIVTVSIAPRLVGLGEG
jgi:hypothetical protein